MQTSSFLLPEAICVYNNGGKKYDSVLETTEGKLTYTP
jgi:hypothetical protein